MVEAYHTAKRLYALIDVESELSIVLNTAPYNDPDHQTSRKNHLVKDLQRVKDTIGQLKALMPTNSHQAVR